MSYNRVIITGNLVADVELKSTQSGQFYAKITVAVNRNWTNKDGSKSEETTFVPVDVFGKQAEIIKQHFTKGRPILVEGRLRTSEWQTQDGQKRKALSVVMESFAFIGDKKDKGAEASEEYRPAQRQQSSLGIRAPQTTVNEDDIPF